jgi:predicted MFS family arabinose efflux permease
MASKSMPGTLLVLVCLQGLGVLLNAVSGALLAAGIGAALLVGILVGNDGVRGFMRGLAAVQILMNLVLMAAAKSQGVAVSQMAIWAIFGIGIPAFISWTLGQPNVREWMFRKNFNLDDVPPPDAPPPS